MTTAVQQLLQSFQALSEADRHEATVEILRQAQDQASATLSDDVLVEAANALFCELDAREAADGRDEAR